MQALDLHVEDRICVECHALRLFDVGGKVELVGALDLVEPREHRAIAGEGLELLELLGMEQIAAPAAEVGNQAVEPRVDLREPAAVVDAVGDVLELLRLHLILPAEYVVAQDVGVQRGNAVDRHAARDAQVRHAHLPIPDDGQLRGLGRVMVEVLDLLLIAVRDLGDDLPHAREQRLHELLRPALERLSEHGVVRVGDGIFCDVPRGIPVEARVVHQNAHQLGNDERGVRVVDLDDVLLVEVRRRAVDLDVLAHDGLHRGGDEEILLLEAQRLTLIVVVLGIEDLGDGLRHRLLLARAQVLALREQAHIHRRRGLRVPQAQEVDVLGAVARDLHVAGHGEHLRRALGHDVQPSVVPELADRAAEEHLLRLLRLGHQPRAADILPVVRQLDLLPVHDTLAEDAQLIADGVARGGDVERGHGIQIAGGEAAEAAVAEARVGLDLENIRRAEAQLADRLAQHAAHAEVVGVLFQAAAQQEFHGKVMHLPLFLAARGHSALHTSLGHHVAQHQRRGAHHLRVVGLLGRHAEAQAQLIRKRLLHSLCRCDIHISLYLPYLQMES